MTNYFHGNGMISWSKTGKRRSQMRNDPRMTKRIKMLEKSTFQSYSFPQSCPLSSIIAYLPLPFLLYSFLPETKSLLLGPSRVPNTGFNSDKRSLH
jgi:hypothetical protein